MESNATSRRAFLIGGAIGLLGYWGVSYLFLGPSPDAASRQHSLAQLLDRGCARYQINASGKDRFIEALETIPTPARSRLLPWYGYGAPLEDALVRGFLLSSHVTVTNGERVAQFQRLWDPYSAVCANPYARLLNTTA